MNRGLVISGKTIKQMWMIIKPPNKKNWHDNKFDDINPSSQPFVGEQHSLQHQTKCREKKI